MIKRAVNFRRGVNGENGEFVAREMVNVLNCHGLGRLGAGRVSGGRSAPKANYCGMLGIRRRLEHSDGVKGFESGWLSNGRMASSAGFEPALSP